MSSFGEALVSAFNGTFGTVTRGRLAAEQAALLRSEREASDTHRRETREAQVRRGLLNPDGSPRDPGQNMDRAQLQAPAPQPAAPVPGLGAPTSPGVQGAAPTPAAPVQGAPPAAATGVPQGAPAQAAPTPAPAPSPAQPALPEHAQGGSPQGAVAQGAQAAMGGQGAPEGQAQRFEPGVQQEVIQEASAAVSRRGDRPSEAMIVAGHTIPTPPRGPGGQGSQAQAAQYAPELLREVVNHRGEGQQGPLTREDWDGYLRDVTLSAQRNLSPQQQVQALAVVDRIRTAGLQRFAALAVASAQAGDMEGAARALNGAASFNPDGYRTQFTATQNGVQMTRQAEGGGQGGQQGGGGQPTRVTVPGAEVVRYATAMLDPTWSLNHYLNVARHEETVRHNRTTEGIAAANLAERRRDRGEREAERQGGNDYARAQVAVSEAERALDRVPEGDTEGRQRAQSALDDARRRRAEALPAAGERGIRLATTIENQRRLDEDRDAARNRMPEAQARRFEEAEREYRDSTAPARGARRDDAQTYALSFGAQVQELNRRATPAQVFDTLEAFRRNPAQFQVNRDRNMIRTPQGAEFRVPSQALPPVAPRTGAPAAPPAPAGGGDGSVRDARGGGTPGGLGSGPPLPASPTPEQARRVREEAAASRTRRAAEQEAQQAERVREWHAARDAALREAGVRRLQDLPTPIRRRLYNSHSGAYTTQERRLLAQ